MIRRGTLAAVVLGVVINAGFTHAKPSVANETRDLQTQIRREIATVPYTGIWDWIEAEIRADGSVVLRGDVTRPSAKSDAEYRIKSLEAVSKVDNEIHVLPLSNFDDEV